MNHIIWYAVCHLSMDIILSINYLEISIKYLLRILNKTISNFSLHIFLLFEINKNNLLAIIHM